MKKYLSIFNMSLKESFQYIESIIFRFLSYTITMFLLTQVWKYVYSGDKEVINGYTLVTMIWYLLFAEIINYASSNNTKMDIQRDIQDGSIAYKIGRPYNYVMYNLMRYFGLSLIRFILYLIVSIIIGIIFVGPINLNLNIIQILIIIFTVFMSVLINGLIKIMISLSSFWVEDSEPFHWIYSKFTLMFGIFFPIEMFPKIVGKFISYSPVFVTTYGPVKLLLNFDVNICINVVIFQFIYLFITAVLTIIIFKKGVKKINVNGG